MKYLGFIFIILLCTFSINNHTWWPRWAMLLTLGSAYLGYRVYLKTHLILGVATFYTLVNGLFISVWRVNQYQGEAPLLRLNLYYGVFYATLAFVFLVYWFTYASKKEIKWIEYAFAGLCIVDSVYVLVQWGIGLTAKYRGGFLNYPGMNGCFIAMTYPLLFKLHNDMGFKIRHFDHWFKPIYAFIFVAPIISIAISNSSMPFGVLASVMTMYLLRKYNWKKSVPTILIGVTILFSVGLKMYDKEFFNDSLRFDTIKRNWRWMQNGEVYREAKNGKPEHWAKVPKWWNPLTGTGNGSYITLGPATLSQPGQKSHLMTWAHSDFWQTFFELGLLGSIIYGILFLLASWKLRHSIYFLCCLTGWLSCALLNYPVHLVPTALFGMFLIRVAYDDGSIKVDN